MKAMSCLIIITLLLSACGPQSIEDTVRREAERAAQEALEQAKKQAQEAFEQAKRDIEEAIKQQAEAQKEEAIRRYVGKGAPDKTVDLFVQTFKQLFPDIGFPVGEVQYFSATETYAQAFQGTEKTYLILSDDQSSLFQVAGTWAVAYDAAGGPGVLGAPSSEAHEWNDGCTNKECRGIVQNFGKGTYQSVLMQREGTEDIFVIQGEAWLQAYLSLRNQGIIGYPVTNRKRYGEKTGMFGWGEFKQLGQMQLFTTASNPYALIVKGDSLLYCYIAAPIDTNSENFPCTSEPELPVAPQPTPTDPSPEDDQQLINYVRGYYIYGTVSGMLAEYGRPKGPKSKRFLEAAIVEDYIQLRTSPFERSLKARSILDVQWDESYAELEQKLLDQVLGTELHWEEYSSLMREHPELKGTVAPIIEWSTGLSPEGDITTGDILINGALTIIPIGKLGKLGLSALKPAGSIITRVGDSWIIKQGSKIIGKISGKIIPRIPLNRLPKEAEITLSKIKDGGPFPHKADGKVFENREFRLPEKPEGYYREYTVETPGAKDRARRRIVTGKDGELYYTEDHFESFMIITDK